MADTVAHEVRAALAAGALHLPAPGDGNTARRHRGLYELARERSVSATRLAEGHADAIAILHEAGCHPVEGALYGVWASASDDVRVSGRKLSGRKPFCSGLGIVDRALITSVSGDGLLLWDVDVGPSSSLSVDLGGWSTPALRASATGTAVFVDHPVGERIGAPGWYLRRPGFWHGACGPAACWAGAAHGLADQVEQLTDEDPHRLAHVGAIRALSWSMEAQLRAAGDQIDEDPTNGVAGRARALSLRQVIERQCTELLDRFGQAFGPRPFVADPTIAERHVDLHLYLRQHHAERDLHALALLRIDGSVR